MVRVQEMPDEVPAGGTLASIVVFMYHDDLVDAVRPGDRVKVMGVFGARSRRAPLSGGGIERRRSGAEGTRGEVRMIVYLLQSPKEC